jgi:hypothetical protein
MFEIPIQNPLKRLIYALKNEAQEGKAGPGCEYVPKGGEGIRKG